MLGTAYRQTIQTEMLDYVWHRFKRLTKLAQNEFAGIILLYSHMHEALCTPWILGRKITGKKRRWKTLHQIRGFCGRFAVVLLTSTIMNSHFGLIHNYEQENCLHLMVAMYFPPRYVLTDHDTI